MKYFLTLVLNLGLFILVQAQTPQIWQDFIDDRANRITPELTDYSFAGYHFSEIPIPSVDTWTKFSITDYGAVADDDQFDDDAIQSAIDAAELHNGPAVVFFPEGKFMISADNSVSNFIRISRDSIVLKGSGAGTGGTEIFMKERRVRNGHWQFLFEPTANAQSGNTSLSSPANRGDYSIIVEDASGFMVGETVLISHKSSEFAEAHFGDLELNPDWTRLFGSGGGMTLHELHEIESISGTRITFVNPIQTDLPLLNLKYTVSHYAVMQEVGVEDILFSSDWATYPEDFVHHKDDIHDYAWNAMQFKNVKNGWVRNCEFSSWNQVIDVRESIGVTITDVVISGKKGHASFLTRRGYGLLVKDCDDQAGQHHGPGTGYSGVNTVYLRCKMLEDQSIDSHSGQPYATLLDDIDGGVMDKNGGPFESYPHHGKGLTFWNYRHKAASQKTYDFWNASSRNGNMYANPNFIGFQSNNLVTLIDEGINQMEGQMVSPRSLFEAQLAIRLEDQEKPVISFITPAYGDQLEIGDDLTIEVEVNDPDGSVTSVTLYLNDEMLREITTSPYKWGTDQATDPGLFNLSGGVYDLKIVADDDSGNTSVDSIRVFVGQAPEVNFLHPDKNAVHESGTPLIVEASASDADGTLSSVALYINDDLISELNNSPYLWDSESALSDLQSGSYTLKLQAKDNDNLVSSAEQEIIVNDYPTLSFLKPSGQLTFDLGSNVQVEVEASDTDGSIEEVELYLNGELQRRETVTPYLWGERDDFDPDLFDMPEGTYELKAVATDDLGSESSKSITITIESAEVISSIDDEFTELSVFPNPFNNQLNLESNLPITRLQWIDVIGGIQKEITFETGVNSLKLSTGSLANGLYFLRIDKLNSNSQILKLIKD